MTLTQTEKGYPPPIEHVSVPNVIKNEKGESKLHVQVNCSFVIRSPVFIVLSQHLRFQSLLLSRGSIQCSPQRVPQAVAPRTVPGRASGTAASHHQRAGPSRSGVEWTGYRGSCGEDVITAAGNSTVGRQETMVRK